MSNENTTSKKPTHIAYHVRKAGEQSYWDRIGVAWVHGDGEGFNLKLSSLPIDGEITVRKPRPQDAA